MTEKSSTLHDEINITSVGANTFDEIQEHHRVLLISQSSYGEYGFLSGRFISPLNTEKDIRINRVWHDHDSAFIIMNLGDRPDFLGIRCCNKNIGEPRCQSLKGEKHLIEQSALTHVRKRSGRVDHLIDANHLSCQPR